VGKNRLLEATEPLNEHESLMYTNQYAIAAESTYCAELLRNASTDRYIKNHPSTWKVSNALHSRNLSMLNLIHAQAR
jgi:hypothetical protein